jgi:predicted acyltransferase
VGKRDDRRDEEALSKKKSARLLSLDVWRGIVMVGMILVDNQGDFAHVVWPLDESEWEGLHPADCIFPGFVFIMGMAISFAMSNSSARTPKNFFRIVRRSVLLFLIGMFLNAEARNFGPVWRIMGVLQRLGIVYLVVALSHFISPHPLLRRFIMVSCAGLYLFFLYGYPVTDLSCDDATGRLDSPSCNASGFVDRKIFGSYMIHPTDPEGSVSTLNSIVTGFLGLELGLLVVAHRSDTDACYIRSSMWSLIVSLLGFWLGTWMPIIKKIWTTSFTLLVAGLTGLGFSFCLSIMDMFPNPVTSAITRPALWLGRNPLAVFVGMVWLEVFLICNVKTASGEPVWNYIYEEGFSSWFHNPYWCSLLFSFAHLVLWVIIAGVLHRLRIFITL